MNEKQPTLDQIKLKLCEPCRRLLEEEDDRALPYSLCKKCFLKHADGEFGVQYIY